MLCARQLARLPDMNCYREDLLARRAHLWVMPLFKRRAEWKTWTAALGSAVWSVRRLAAGRSCGGKSIQPTVGLSAGRVVARIWISAPWQVAIRKWHSSTRRDRDGKVGGDGVDAPWALSLAESLTQIWNLAPWVGSQWNECRDKHARYNSTVWSLTIQLIFVWAICILYPCVPLSR